MAQHVTETDVRHMAAYVRIALSDDELVQMTADLNAIIESLKPICEYDLEGVEPTFHPFGGGANVVRQDAVRPGLTQAEAISNASSTSEGAFRVPAILADGV
jgi:aspartyl-tRNA(Asn)/glutamyl-tRNA(Gln) amidotransferase subunit C